MSEQGFSEAENSPAVAGPEGPAAEQVGEPDVDWQKRYLDTQAEYSRSQQENAEMRRQQELYDLLVSSEDADTRRQVAEQLGYALDEEQPEFDEENPWSTYDSRLDRIEAALTQRQQDEQDTQQVAVIRDHVEQRFDALGIDKGDQDWVLAYATNALPATAEGMPDIEQAYQLHQQREDERQKAWARTKRAPHISPHGQAATEVPNLDDRQQRWEYMTRRINDSEPAS